eukprot:scaffold844_cov139-Isochrysis_galbana.AAC.12
MRAAVVPVPGRAAIARAAASGAAPTLQPVSEGDPTTHVASRGEEAQSGKRKRAEELGVQAPSLLPPPAVAASGQHSARLVVVVPALSRVAEEVAFCLGDLELIPVHITRQASSASYVVQMLF